jgi:hypothetical protein
VSLLTLLFDSPSSIGPDLKPTYPENPDPDEDLCETATASVCTTTFSYGVVAKRAAAAPTQAPQIHGEGKSRKLTKRATTTTTSTISFCTQVTGCGASEITTTTSIEATATTNPRVIIPRDPASVDGVRATLQQQLGGSALDLFESRTLQLGTIFFFVPAFTDDQTAAIRGHAQVADAYIPRGRLMRDYWATVRDPTSGGGGGPFARDDDVGGDDDDDDDDWFIMDTLNSTESEMQERSVLAKRSETVQSNQPNVMALLSWPPSTGPVPSEEAYRCAVPLLLRDSVCICV